MWRSKTTCVIHQLQAHHHGLYPFWKRIFISILDCIIEMRSGEQTCIKYNYIVQILSMFWRWLLLFHIFWTIHFYKGIIHLVFSRQCHVHDIKHFYCSVSARHYNFDCQDTSILNEQLLAVWHSYRQTNLIKN